MAKISAGTISLSQDSTRVIGSSTTDWSSVTAGDLFVIEAEQVGYIISDVINKLESASGNWELTLRDTYNNDTVSDVAYSINPDFTPFYGLPWTKRGDVALSTLVRRAFETLDRNLDFTEVPDLPDNTIKRSASDLNGDQQVSNFDLIDKAQFVRFHLLKNSGDAITGFKIGTTVGGSEILPSVDIPETEGQLYDLLTLVQTYGIGDPTSESTSVYVSADNWGTGTVSLETAFLLFTTDQTILNQLPMQSAIVARWSFNGDLNDSGPTGYPLVAVQTTGGFITDRNGNINSAYALDGTGGLRADGATTFLRTTPQFTVSLWFKLNNDLIGDGSDSTSGTHQALMNADDGPYLWFFPISGRLQLRIAGSSGSIRTNKNSWLANQWYHIMAVYDSNTAIYVDGVLDVSGTDTVGSPANGSGLYFGRSHFTATNYFNGAVDNIIIYNESLGAIEAAQLFLFDDTRPIS